MQEAHRVDLRDPAASTASIVQSAAEELQLLKAAARRSTWARLRRQPPAMLALLVVALVCLAALAASLLAPHDPNFQFDAGLTDDGTPLGNSGQFLLGTDTAGRDVLSRLLFGARISLTVGLLSTLLTVLIGASLGALAAYRGGWTERLVMRLVDIMLAFPVVLLGLAASAVFGPSLPTTIAVIALTQWMYMARVIYGMVCSLKEWEFVTAAQAIGAGHLRILVRHIAPHLAPVAIAYATLGVGVSILLEATLSFLNAGVPQPTASWGAMISSGVTYYRTDPQLVLYPGLLLAVVVLAFNVLGDGLTRALAHRVDR